MYTTQAQSSRTRYTQASDSKSTPNLNGDFTPNIWWDTPISGRGVNAWIDATNTNPHTLHSHLLE